MATPADFLFAERNASVYAILDGAAVDGLLDRLYDFDPEFVCLYRGNSNPTLPKSRPIWSVWSHARPSSIGS